MSAAGPCGSYTLTLKWLKEHSQERIRCPGGNVIISFFDNNQVNKVIENVIYLWNFEHTCMYNLRLIFFLQILKVIGRKWRVKIDDFKAESSVITAVIHMVTDDNIQTRADYSPSSWQKFDTHY